MEYDKLAVNNEVCIVYTVYPPAPAFSCLSFRCTAGAKPLERWSTHAEPELLLSGRVLSPHKGDPEWDN